MLLSYAKATAKFAAQLSAAADAPLRAELRAFRGLQEDLARLCPAAEPGSQGLHLTRADFGDVGAWTAHLRDGWRTTGGACRWYRMADLEYEKQIGTDGIATPVAFEGGHEGGKF